MCRNFLLTLMLFIVSACGDKEIPVLEPAALTRMPLQPTTASSAYTPRPYATTVAVINVMATETPTATPTKPIATATPTRTPTAASTPTSTSTSRLPTSTPATIIQRATATPTLPPRVVPHVPNPSYGVAVAFAGQADMRRQALARVQELGFSWVKAQVLWSSVEGSKQGLYDWSLVDAVVNETNARGLNLLVSVTAAPDWARPGGDDRSVHGFPANPQDLADFLGAFAARYAGKVKAIEVWNEQNLWVEVGGRGRMNVSNYLTALRASYVAVKNIDPNIIVVSAGLTPTGTNDGRVAVDDRQYLRQMYAGGLAKISDAIGAHPSGYNLPPEADWRTFTGCRAFPFPCTNRHPSWSFKATMDDYHAIMQQYGDGVKQIWATEFGWASQLGGKKFKGYEYSEDNSAWQMGEYLRGAYQLAKGWEWTGVMFVWNLNYAVIEGVNSERAAFSILDENANPRDAFNTLKGMPKC